MKMWGKCSPRALKTSHLLLPEGWFTWGGPGFKMIAPESNSGNSKGSLYFCN